jgi:hypothetical protein
MVRIRIPAWLRTPGAFTDHCMEDGWRGLIVFIASFFAGCLLLFAVLVGGLMLLLGPGTGPPQPPGPGWYRAHWSSVWTGKTYELELDQVGGPLTGPLH